jgi:CheY-like chemotaxis protein
VKTTAAIATVYQRLKADIGLFARSSINVIEVPDGFALVTLCKHEHIDLVLLDLVENATTTAALCRTLRGLEQSPAVLVLSKTVEKRALKQVRDAGAGEILADTATAQEVIEASAKLLGVPLREDVRILTRLRVEASVAHGTHMILGTIVDISLSGMLVESSSMAEVNDVLSAEFYLPGDKKQIALMAKVARIVPAGDSLRHLGLRFVTGQDDATARIRTFIDARQK